MSDMDAVCEGVALLDEKIPGWRAVIDWGILDIWSLDKCIVGQLANHESNTSKISGSASIWDLLGIQGYREGRKYGFDVETGLGPETYESINAAWKQWARSEGLYA